MTDQEILSHVDHTLLKASAGWEDIRKLCEEAVEYKTASVCIPPSYVKAVTKHFGNSLPVCTVIGFPLGYSVGPAKLAEAECALSDGASEIDMVINITDVKNQNFDAVYNEISLIRKAAGANILKVIIETCYLTAEEKIRMCGIVTDAKADFIKTSTGFGSAGATMEDIILFKEHIGPSVKMKAAGGIRSREDMEAFLSAGCERLGTSSAIAILGGGASKGY